jgi:hypothetical protein
MTGSRANCNAGRLTLSTKIASVDQGVDRGSTEWVGG